MGVVDRAVAALVDVERVATEAGVRAIGDSHVAVEEDGVLIGYEMPRVACRGTRDGGDAVGIRGIQDDVGGMQIAADLDVAVDVERILIGADDAIRQRSIDGHAVRVDKEAIRLVGLGGQRRGSVAVGRSRILQPFADHEILIVIEGRRLEGGLGHADDETRYLDLGRQIPHVAHVRYVHVHCLLLTRGWF